MVFGSRSLLKINQFFPVSQAVDPEKSPSPSQLLNDPPYTHKQTSERTNLCSPQNSQHLVKKLKMRVIVSNVHGNLTIRSRQIRVDDSKQTVISDRRRRVTARTSNKLAGPTITTKRVSKGEGGSSALVCVGFAVASHIRVRLSAGELLRKFILWHGLSHPTVSVINRLIRYGPRGAECSSAARNEGSTQRIFGGGACGFPPTTRASVHWWLTSSKLRRATSSQTLHRFQEFFFSFFFVRRLERKNYLYEQSKVQVSLLFFDCRPMITVSIVYFYRDSVC